MPQVIWSNRAPRTPLGSHKRQALGSTWCSQRVKKQVASGRGAPASRSPSTAFGMLGPSLLGEALEGRHIHLGFKKGKEKLFVDKNLCLEKEIFQKMGVYRGGKTAHRLLTTPPGQCPAQKLGAGGSTHPGSPRFCCPPYASSFSSSPSTLTVFTQVSLARKRGALSRSGVWGRGQE